MRDKRSQKSTQSDMLYTLGSQTVPMDREDSNVSYNTFTARFKRASNKYERENSVTSQNSQTSQRSRRGPNTGLFRRRKNSLSSENSDYSVGSVRSVRFNGDLGKIARRAQTPSVSGKKFDWDSKSVTGGDYGKYTARRDRGNSTAFGYRHKPPPGTVEVCNPMFFFLSLLLMLVVVVFVLDMFVSIVGCLSWLLMVDFVVSLLVLCFLCMWLMLICCDVRCLQL